MRKRHLAAVSVLLALVGGACGSRVDDRGAATGAVSQDSSALAAPGAGGPGTGATAETPVPGASATAAPSAGTATLPAASGAAAPSAAASPRAASSVGASKTSAAAAQSQAPAAQAAPASQKPTTAGTPSPGAPTPGAVPGLARSGDGSPVAIGWIGTQSGTLGAVGRGMPAAVRAWVQDANSRGGLNGHPIKLVMVDDGGDPNRSVALARRMIEQDGVLAFLGTFAPTTLQALVPLLEEKQVPVISTCGCSPAEDSSEMVFPIGPSGDTGQSWAQITPMLKGNVAPEKLQKVGLIYCREVPSCPHIRELIRSYQGPAGFKLVWEAQASIAAPDFTAEMISARNAGVEALTMVMDNSSVVRIERSAKQQGYAPQFVNQQSGHEDRVIKDGRDDVEGHLTAATTLPWDSHPKMADFRAAMDKYQPNEVKGSWGAQAYVSGLLLEKMARSFSPKPTSADVLNGLWSLRGETVDGRLPPISYVKGQKNHGNVNLCIVPVRITKGKFVPTQGDEFSCAPGWKPAA